MLVIYHANCADGFCAAWIVHKIYPDAMYYAAYYGQEPPEFEDGTDIIMVDFSYKRDIILKMVAKAKSILILDHHKTAKAELVSLPDNVEVIFDMNKSGGRITWDHFFLENPAPWLVHYTMDRDLWQWKLPASRAINAALSTYDKSFDMWTTLEFMEKGVLVMEGDAILRYQKQVIAEHVKHANKVEICGHKVLAVNASSLMSEIGEQLCKDRLFSAIYFKRSDGKWQWSLRSDKNGLDVSEIANKFGGGGHKNASGFVTKELII